jgi:cytochrome P450
MRNLLDDWYEGMLLPKDSVIWLAAWVIQQNDAEYPDHDRFDPDRFVNHKKLANEYAVGPDWENRDKFPSDLAHINSAM